MLNISNSFQKYLPYFFKHAKSAIHFFAVLAATFSLHATYIPVYSTTGNGGLAWTGNSLGLSKAPNQNQPGTADSIGAFSTLNTSLQVGLYPPGTTLDWTLNGSQATLDLPSGSTVLYAQLIWSGSYGADPAINGAVLDTPITFIPPSGIPQIIAPNPATSQSIPNSSFPTIGVYVRSADVTSFVTGSGIYSAGGIPATVLATQNSLNCAGWTLAVAYQNSNMLTTSSIIYVAGESSFGPVKTVTGFTAPTTGSVSARLFVSAAEGDTNKVQDRLLVSSTLPLNSSTAIFGTNNPVNNFFCSQINTLLTMTTDVLTGKFIATGSSLLDNRGTFGNRNGIASTSTMVSGQRQGYDITSIDISNKLSNGTQQLFIQGISGPGEDYAINSLGLQIQINAPIIQALKQVAPTSGVLNTVLTFTSTFTNIGQADASSLVFTDILATGLTYVPGTFTINGVPFVNPDLNNGVPLGNLTVGSTVTVVFDAQITAISPPTSYDNFASVSYLFNPFNDPNPVPVSVQTNTVTVSTPAIVPPVAVDDTASTNANVTLNGTGLLSNDTGTAISVTGFTATVQAGSSVNVQPDGSFTYIPPTNFSGTDSFTYTITDSVNQSDTATVTITVFPVAQADSGTIAANTPLNQNISVLSNDAGTGLSVTAYDSLSIQGGSVVMQPTGTYVYTPPLNFSGFDTFNYTITDAIGNTSTSVVTIAVLPAAADDVGTTPANTTLNGSTVFTNDIGTGLTIIAYDSISTQGGSVTMNTTTGTYVYIPPLNFSGIDTFTYTVQDTVGNITVATVTITVLPVAVNDTGTTTTNVSLNGTSLLANDLGSGLSIFSYTSSSIQGGTVLVNTITGTYLYIPPNNFSGTDTFAYVLRDTIDNHSAGTVTITVQPSASPDTAVTNANTTLIGSSVLNNDFGMTLTVISAQNPSSQGGTVSMNANGTYVYVPPIGFSGIDTFTYTVQDSSGGTSPGLVTITVLPTAETQYETTPADTPLNGPSVFNGIVGSGVTIVNYQTTSDAGGTVVMDTTTGLYIYTPPPGYSGPDSFVYLIQDSSGSDVFGRVNINVTPVANLLIVSTFQNTPVTGPSVLDSTIGTDISVISYQSISSEGGTIDLNLITGIFTYTPPLNFFGTDSFTYVIEDAFGNRTTGIVLINVLSGPQKFFGKLIKYEFLNKNEYRLKAKWQQGDSNVKYYRIYYKNRLAAQFDSNDSQLVYKKTLKSKKSAYLYSLSFVYLNNTESSRIKIRIDHE